VTNQKGTDMTTQEYETFIDAIEAERATGGAA
jgi:hypothetical protein